MTDRLTPMLIVAMALDECADIDHRYGDSGLARRYEERAAQIRRGEAARREAEARPTRQVDFQWCENCPTVEACGIGGCNGGKRKGPGSAAPKVPLIMCPDGKNACRSWHCDTQGCSRLNAENLIEDKPAPAADDLVLDLRFKPGVSGYWPEEARFLIGQLCKERDKAADRIEAQAREIAIYRDGVKAANDGILDAYAQRDAEKARADKLVRLARQMLGETYVVTGERPSSPVGRPTVVVDYDAALAMWDAISTEGGDRG